MIDVTTLCDPVIGSDTCGQPTDPVPSLLAPRVVRVAKTGTFPWEVHCEIDPFHCKTRAKTKREATEWATAPSWLRFAAEAAERQNLTRIAPPPQSACAKNAIEPFDPTLEAPWHPSGWGDWAACGRPCNPALGDARALATHRLGWSAERMRDALSVDYRGGTEWNRWVAAGVQAGADLLAGNITPEEEVVLGATPETASWLRLYEYERGRLASRVHPAELPEIRATYTPGYTAHDRYCWAVGHRGSES